MVTQGLEALRKSFESNSQERFRHYLVSWGARMPVRHVRVCSSLHNFTERQGMTYGMMHLFAFVGLGCSSTCTRGQNTQYLLHQLASSPTSTSLILLLYSRAHKCCRNSSPDLTLDLALRNTTLWDSQGKHPKPHINPR